MDIKEKLRRSNYQPNNDYYKPSYKYCPNCGTKMIEPQGSEDKA